MGICLFLNTFLPVYPHDLQLPVDWKISEGNFQQMFPLQFPSTMGIDFAGVIKRDGSMKSIANKPIRLSYPEAAGLPLVGVAAWRVLTEDIGLSIINSPS
ncbi:MAG: hypothetical protein WBP88_12515 [Nitrososphaeraceae archaeon]